MCVVYREYILSPYEAVSKAESFHSDKGLYVVNRRLHDLRLAVVLVCSFVMAVLADLWTCLVLALHFPVFTSGQLQMILQRSTASIFHLCLVVAKLIKSLAIVVTILSL